MDEVCINCQPFCWWDTKMVDERCKCGIPLFKSDHKSFHQNGVCMRNLEAGGLPCTCTFLLRSDLNESRYTRIRKGKEQCFPNRVVQVQVVVNSHSGDKHPTALMSVPTSYTLWYSDMTWFMVPPTVGPFLNSNLCIFRRIVQHKLIWKSISVTFLFVIEPSSN